MQHRHPNTPTSRGRPAPQGAARSVTAQGRRTRQGRGAKPRALIMDRLPTALLGAPTPEIRGRLSALPAFGRFAAQVDASLAIMDRCRTWLRNEEGAALCHAAYLKNDSIYQNVSYAGSTMLADEVRWAANLFDAASMAAIAAFAFASSLRALKALDESMRGVQPDELEALDLFRTYTGTIVECVDGAGVRLTADECDACNELGDMAEEAVRHAAFKADGVWSGIVRRGADGTKERDRAIEIKALELIMDGTKSHNLNSKLRAWQRRETGSALTKPAMGALLRRLLPWLG